MMNESIAHYKITGMLGHGGMGEVYRATDTKLDRDVAIKIMPTGILKQYLPNVMNRNPQLT